MMDGYYIKRVGKNRGAPRVWFEGTQTERAGFKPGQRYDIVVNGQMVVLQANPDGSRVVSAKKAGERSLPVIDLNSRDLLAVFDGMAAVRVVVKKGEIYLMPLASEIKKRERFARLRDKLERGEPLTIGSVSHGGGVLSHALHAGLGRAGVESRLSFANDIREDLLEHAAVHNDAWSDDTQVLSAPMQELAFDARGLAHVPRVEVLEIGIPCSAASKAGRAKRGLAGRPEAHPEVGHLVVAALVILNKANPAVVVLENVPSYENTASADILRNQLRDMGYVTHERILRGAEWGSLENRDRWCLIAVSDGIQFDFAGLVAPGREPRALAEVLDSSIGPNDERWRTFDYLKRKEVRDAESGKGFGMQIVEASATSVPTLRKGYHKGGSTDPLLRHPNDPDLLRLFTASEHAKIKGVPGHLIEDLPNAVAHELLGQSVLYETFRDVGEHLGDVVRRIAAGNTAPDAGTLAEALESVRDLARASGVTVAKLNEAHGCYKGEVLAIDANVAIQDVGRGEAVVHARHAVTQPLRLGETVKVAYEKGRGCVTRRVPTSQLGLDL